MTKPTTRPACISDGCPDVGAYFACLACYNSGRLYGVWVDLEGATDAEDLGEAIAWMLAASPAPDAEEWAMHDSSGLPACLFGTEHPDLNHLVDFADGLCDVGPDEDTREAFRLYCDNLGEVVDPDDFRDHYRGCWSSGEAFAQDLADELDAVPDNMPWPLSCIDWEWAWRELTYDGFRTEPCSSGGVHVFRSF